MTCIQENITLAPFTYYKIGGPARFYAQPKSEHDLVEISKFIKANKPRVFILGAGSNVLFDDQGFDGLVIHTSKINGEIKKIGEDRFQVGASTMVIQLLRKCMGEGVGGLELLVGIPGSMGGVFAMNAGTKLGEIKSVVEELTCFDLDSGQTRRLAKTDLQYSYRAQHFLKQHEIIISGVVKGKPSKSQIVQNEVTSLLEERKKTQPIDKPSCGSVFKNPAKANAWKLIADAGLRGYRIGNAQISELHTNFIVNLGGAKAADVKALIEEVKAQVLKKLGVTLEEEVRIIPYL